jgi:predicted phage tail protein
LLVYDWNTGQTIRQTATATTWSPPPLAPGHYYQWWVRALNSSGDIGLWSSGASFVLNFATATPIGPIGSVTNATPTFIWSAVAAADFYDVYVLDTTTWQQALRTPLSGTQVVTGSSWIPTTALIAGHSYTWWVRAMTLNGGTGPWSQAASFTLAYLATPSVMSPTGVVSTTTPLLTWTAVSANYYDLWVDDLTTGQSQVLRNTHIVGHALTTTALTVGHSYRCRVRALNFYGDYSLWSAWDIFTIS